jgi:ATP-dependent DNA helicase RecG
MNGNLENSVQFLKGVGPRRADFLKKIGIETIEDLLHYYPRAWQNRLETTELNRPTPGGQIILRGRILNAGGNRSFFKIACATFRTS